jgi:hypothetical protein
MPVATFEACCAQCARKFVYPDLGDFAYGSFLFTGEHGSVFAVFDALESPVWQRVAAAVAQVRPEIPEVQQGPLIQKVCALLADRIDGQGLRNCHICPHCQSTEWKWWHGARIGTVELPRVSYCRFLERPSLDQESEIRLLLLTAAAE